MKRIRTVLRRMGKGLIPWLLPMLTSVVSIRILTVCGG